MGAFFLSSFALSHRGSQNVYTTLLSSSSRKHFPRAISTLKCFKASVLFIYFYLSLFFFHLYVAMLSIVERCEWGGRDPKLVETFDGPIPFVIIHHSYIPSACYNEEACTSAMRKMQDMHQLQNGWNDIGYSFAVGGDGRIYRGRGYNVIGAHAPRYNDKSIGICLIGDWRSNCQIFTLFGFLCRKRALRRKLQNVITNSFRLLTQSKTLKWNFQLNKFFALTPIEVVQR